MRILVISNLYPPHYIGGYELGCQEVVEALKSRGHEVKILTSTYRIGAPQINGDVYRWLKIDPEWKSKGAAKSPLKLLKKEMTNQRSFKRLVHSFRPHLIYAWKLTGVSVSIAFLAQRMGLTVCYFVFDYWLSQMEDDDPWYWIWNLKSPRLVKELGKRMLRPFINSVAWIPSGSLDLRHAQFASSHLKKTALQTGKPVATAKVIHWGINSNQFPYKETANNPKRLLYVGQIVRHKGVHTAIEAMKILVKEYGYSSVRLTLAGGSEVPDYLSYIQNQVRSYGLEDNCFFAGFVPRDGLPRIYQEHDILLFPSVWDEPFGIVLLEAMSCGLAVVATATGGSSEIVQHEVNALVFPKEDARACANQIQRLLTDRQLFERIRQKGRRTVEERFRFEHMMGKIEHALQEAVS